MRHLFSSCARRAFLVSALAVTLAANIAQTQAEVLDRRAEVEQLIFLANRGSVEAMFAIAEMYREKRPVPHDFAQAAKWYRSAAMAGHTRARFALAVFYYSGRLGVPRDFVQALAWLILAAAVPERELADFSIYEIFKALMCQLYGLDQCEKRGVIALMHDALTDSMTPDQIAEAQRMAREWFEGQP